MAAPWLNGPAVFSFGCKFYMQSGCNGQSQSATPIKHKTPYLKPETIRESILDFTAHFGEINPDMRNKPRHALYLQTGSVRAPKGRFCLFSLCSERVDEKKTLNLRFFAKKQVNF